MWAHAFSFGTKHEVCVCGQKKRKEKNWFVTFCWNYIHCLILLRVVNAIPTKLDNAFRQFNKNNNIKKKRGER